MAKRKNRLEVVPSSGNVFADLGITNPEEKQTKVRLAVAVNQIIQDRKLSRTAAARRLHVNQPKVSALTNYQLEGFSVGRLVNFVTPLDRDVDIVIRRKPNSRKIAVSQQPPPRSRTRCEASKWIREEWLGGRLN